MQFPKRPSHRAPQPVRGYRTGLDPPRETGQPPKISERRKDPHLAGRSAEVSAAELCRGEGIDSSRRGELMRWSPVEKKQTLGSRDFRLRPVFRAVSGEPGAGAEDGHDGGIHQRRGGAGGRVDGMKKVSVENRSRLECSYSPRCWKTNRY